MRCPICRRKLEKKRSLYLYGDINLGEYDSEVCKKCGEVFFTETASDKIDTKAKELGVWGLEKKTKISYSRNSLIVRIPKQITGFMGLKKR